MSPEIINGFEIDLPTDVFSLGIIFVEILCRRLVDSKNFIVSVPCRIAVLIGTFGLMISASRPLSP
jgi:LIM domain kinase 1